MYTEGDADAAFTIQSVSKPFSLALALARSGHSETYARVGTEPSGDAFNSVVLDPATSKPFNPMINSGAIAIAGLLRDTFGGDAADEIQQGYERFAGAALGFDEDV